LGVSGKPDKCELRRKEMEFLGLSWKQTSQNGYQERSKLYEAEESYKQKGNYNIPRIAKLYQEFIKILQRLFGLTPCQGRRNGQWRKKQDTGVRNLIEKDVQRTSYYGP